MQRIGLGEEVDYHYCADILKEALSQWNYAIDSLKQKLGDPKFVLDILAQETQDDTGKSVESTMQEITQRISSIRPLQLKESDDGFLLLV